MNICKIQPAKTGFFKTIRLVFLSILALSVSTSCAYRLGYGDRSLPGGYDRLSIPIFENKTDHVGIEVYFSNSLIRQFETSRVARLTSADEAPLNLEGTITEVRIDRSSAPIKGGESGARNLPLNAVLAVQYRLLVYASLRLRRKSDREVVWQSAFVKEGVYAAPRVGLDRLNSANANYNESARDQKIAEIAEDMMEEAHDRMTENF